MGCNTMNNTTFRNFIKKLQFLTERRENLNKNIWLFEVCADFADYITMLYNSYRLHL